MPPTATLEDIKAHQRRVEKNKITSDDLPPCPRCLVDSALFKIHAYRERRFLIIIEMLIKAADMALYTAKAKGKNCITKADDHHMSQHLPPERS